MTPTEILLALQSLVLAALALRWLLAPRVKVIREGEYTDGVPRTFIRPEVRTDGTMEGTHLADARTGRALQFVGVEAAQVQTCFTGGGKWAQVSCYLKNVPIEYRKKD